MDALGIIAIVLGILGILGGFLPVLPGPPLSWIALLLVYFSDKAADPVSKTALFVSLAIALIITVADYILPSYFTKLTGGHKAAERGAMIGLIAGIFFTPIGMVLGSFLGAFLGEYLIEKQDITASLKSALGAFLAFILSTGIKVIFSAVIFWQILTHLF